MRRVNISLTQRGLIVNDKGAIGIGTLIIFIAMIMVAGITASVIVETMNSLQQQALKTGTETIKDVSSGVRVSHVTGYKFDSNITELAIFLRTTAGSDDIDLTYTTIKLSDSSTEVILNYTTSAYNNSITSGVFNSLDSSLLTSSLYGLMVISDIDGSCTSTSPTINNDDLVILLVNATQCFSGISTRTKVFGNILPEYGISGVISFTTPSSYTNTIIELQP